MVRVRWGMLSKLRRIPLPAAIYGITVIFAAEVCVEIIWIGFSLMYFNGKVWASAFSTS
ncbi:MAG: hypothetical protein QXO01_02670 [Nitrososphaerota archaeon]